MYNNFLGYKPFVLKLLKNQCPADSLQMLYCSNSYDYGDKISQYHEVYITLFKYFPRLKNSCIFNNVVAGLLNCDKPNLNKLRSNIQLFSLLVTNGLSRDIFSTLVTTEDFKNLKINGNKELLDFLLNNQLITFDKDKLNFIRDYPLASSLLKKDDITIEDLKSKSIKEIQEKIKKLSQEKILKMD